MLYLLALAAVQACCQRPVRTSVSVVPSAPLLRASILDSDTCSFFVVCQKA